MMRYFINAMERRKTMKKQKILVIMLSMFMVLIGGMPALAQMYGMGSGPGPLRALMALDLTDAQKTQIAEIMAETKTDREAARQKREEVRNILAPVFKAETFNEENVRAAFRQASALMEDSMVMRVRVVNQIRALLTDEQLLLVKEKMENGMERMKKHAEFKETMLNTWLKTASE
jgi:Spy/CpxP family protein refolding chaperone